MGHPGTRQGQEWEKACGGKREKRETRLLKSGKMLSMWVGGRASVGVMVHFTCQLAWAKGCLDS